MSVTEIAFATGFGSLGLVPPPVRPRPGTTPRAYRQTFRGGVTGDRDAPPAADRLRG